MVRGLEKAGGAGCHIEPSQFSLQLHFIPYSMLHVWSHRGIEPQNQLELDRRRLETGFISQTPFCLQGLRSLGYLLMTHCVALHTASAPGFSPVNLGI